MSPVRIASNPDKVVDMEKGLTDYKGKYPAKEVQVIQYEGKDIGRLRVVRSKEEIYIGGIQILPEFQSKGIGSAVVKDLIEESEELKIPITLEVHGVNTSANIFYSKLGFKFVEQKKNQSVLKYSPVSSTL
jgi:ribosomal protein S18 acetylase RimI-like enzyme